MVKADITSDASPQTQAIMKDLTRVDRSQIPVMMMYPAEYPEKPAVLMEGLIFADDVLQALDIVSSTDAGQPANRQAKSPVSTR